MKNKKKIENPANMKSVRIDNRTVIRVDRSIPDDIARDNYIKKVSMHPVEKNIFRGSKNSKKEDLANPMLPDIEDTILEGSEDDGEDLIN